MPFIQTHGHIDMQSNADMRSVTKDAAFMVWTLSKQMQLSKGRHCQAGIAGMQQLLHVDMARQRKRTWGSSQPCFRLCCSHDLRQDGVHLGTAGTEREGTQSHMH